MIHIRGACSKTVAVFLLCPSMLGTPVLSIRFMNNRFEGITVKGNREGLTRLVLLHIMLLRLVLPRLMEQQLW
jgi:hypothetical protein